MKGESVPGMEFAGGAMFAGPWGSAASANLTPDATGIPYYDEPLFLQVMRSGYVKARPLNPIMPVMVYTNLTDTDLKAMFAYLRTLKPVKHQVDNSEPPYRVQIVPSETRGGSGQLGRGIYSFTFRKRSEFVITDTELKLIAAAARIGLSSNPNTGYSTPAAIGTPIEL